MKNKKETQNVSVEELLEKMTLDEKLQQLTQLSGVFFDAADKTAATGPKEDVGISDNDLPGIGSTLNFRGAEQVRRIQEAHLEADRNKIPMLFMMDVIHGCRTIYPVNLGMGATFNPKLMEECSAMAAREARAMGVRVTFAPMVDLVRDARWGRVMESTGEDAYLNGLFAAAQVKGFQREGVAACVKHFAAYGAPEAGRDYNTVDMSELTLREKYLVAYKAAVDAGVKMVMTSFNSLNGVPAAANRKLVKGILRDEWGFDGVIISDYNAFREMMNHGVAKDEKDCAYKAMQATNDIEMMSAAYLHCMKDLIAEGKISQIQVNDAVRRVLNLKKDLGLFEEPYRFLPKTKEEAEKTQKSEILTAENRVLARIAAEKSAVLLKNKGVLPFKKNAKKIAVIGPFGNTGDIIGFWNCYGNGNDTVKITDGVKNLLPDAEICFAQGVSGALDAFADEKEIEDAARLAAGADVVLLTLGEPEGGQRRRKQQTESRTARSAVPIARSGACRKQKYRGAAFFRQAACNQKIIRTRSRDSSRMAAGHGSGQRNRKSRVRRSFSRRQTSDELSRGNGAVPDSLRLFQYRQTPRKRSFARRLCVVVYRRTESSAVSVRLRAFLYRIHVRQRLGFRGKTAPGRSNQSMRYR